MNIDIQNLDIVFRRTQPEDVYYNLFDGIRRKGILASDYPVGDFRSHAQMDYPTLSAEELEGIHQIAQSAMGASDGKKNVFNLARSVADKYLIFVGDLLRCRYECVLEWQELYLKLGQDLFTTLKYAREDIMHGINRTTFAWETVIRTNDLPFHQSLQKGLAENHFHLNGSSQSFSIMWASIMNHPFATKDIDKILGVNLQVVERRIQAEPLWTWEERLRFAALIRVYLFSKRYPELQETVTEEAKNALQKDGAFYRFRYLDNMVDQLRNGYGLRIRVPGKSMAVLDYALDQNQAELAEHHNRLLSGERNFLYQCYRALFEGRLSSMEQNLFYIYVLIKENYRSEIIQVNQQYGFTNFREYQDRKTLFIDGFPEYERELLRISVRGNMSDYPIKTLEARFVPATSWEAMCKKINNYDSSTDLKDAADHHYFFTAHFVKLSDFKRYSKVKFLLPLRNEKSRDMALKGAIALRTAIGRVPYLRERIFGIDAATTEVGCRPEVFSVPFRLLRTHVINYDNTLVPDFGNPWQKKTSTFLQDENDEWEERLSGAGKNARVCRLGKTYHAGEDFCDMLDGLRTIDEAIRFLDLERGDRLGHALALGVEPAVHYRTKNMRSVLTRQERLDNIIWAVHMADEYNIPLDGGYRSRLNNEAEQLINEIYLDDLQAFGIQNVTTLEYYQSWLLRQDPPECYRRLTEFEEKQPFPYMNVLSDAPELKNARKIRSVVVLNALYHYSATVRYVGMERMEQNVTEDDIALVRALQDRMQYDIAQKGIYIECNPTSNYLIGTFRDYRLHPIFRFYPVKEDQQKKRWLQVSVNTDDIGVFDTSLENEYVLLAAALREMKDENGRRLYTNEEIEHYLNDLRLNGFAQAFEYNVQ